MQIVSLAQKHIHKLTHTLNKNIHFNDTCMRIFSRIQKYISIAKLQKRMRLEKMNNKNNNNKLYITAPKSYYITYKR